MNEPEHESDIFATLAEAEAHARALQGRRANYKRSSLHNISNGKFIVYPRRARGPGHDRASVEAAFPRVIGLGKIG